MCSPKKHMTACTDTWIHTVIGWRRKWPIRWEDAMFSKGKRGRVGPKGPTSIPPFRIESTLGPTVLLFWNIHSSLFCIEVPFTPLSFMRRWFYRSVLSIVVTNSHTWPLTVGMRLVQTQCTVSLKYTPDFEDLIRKKEWKIYQWFLYWTRVEMIIFICVVKI